jgi:Domain of unknown function (DUF4249)
MRELILNHVKSVRLAHLWGIFILLLDSCIQPLDVHSSSKNVAMVVDGLITDQPGPYTVKLYTTLAIDDQLDETDWIQGATVELMDDVGNSETLKEVSAGNYQTSATQGVIGRTYHIQIRTSDGTSYESLPETLLPVGAINNLSSQFSSSDPSNASDVKDTKNGFNILVDAEVLPEQQGLVRWRWTGTFEIRAYPELRTKAIVTGGVITIVPDPVPCSGYITYGRPIAGIMQIADCSCCFCWVTQYSSVPILSDARFVSNNTISHFNVDFVPANRRYFYDKYYLVVEQMSVSQTVYNFWKKISTQQQNGSSLFQTPPAVTTGNMKALTPGAMTAIGIFGASAIKSETLIMLRSDVPYPLPPIDTLAVSCQEAYLNSSNVQPSFW